ncbi:MAG: glycosyltransferase family 4 protein [Bauldia sp.]
MTGLETPELYVTNFNPRFTGVSATAAALAGRQAKHYRLQLVGRPLPGLGPPISWRRAVALSRRVPAERPFALWHVRRNAEMLAALYVRDVLRRPIRIVFTSAAIRTHSAVPRWLISRMDAVVATGEAAAALVPHVASVVPHGVDTERFGPVADRTPLLAALGLDARVAIGAIGRVRPEKGTDLFVEAMCRCLPRHPDAVALVVGAWKAEHAAFKAGLDQRIRAGGLEGRIRFLGEVPSEDMPRLMAALSVLVAAPRYEGFGLTAIEAMSSACAVVATETGAFPSVVVEGETGYLVPVGDIDRLAGRIDDLLSARDRIAAFGAAGRRRAVERLSIAEEMRGVAAVYERVWNGERF